MNGKIHLVALRELIENVRTKTFWVGILVFPLIFVIAVVVTRFMAKAKGEKTYAVLDRSESQWLSQAIRVRQAQAGIDELARRMQQQDAGAQAAAEEFRRRIDELPPEHPVRRLVDLARLELGDPPHEDSKGLAGALLARTTTWALSLSAPEREQVRSFLAPSDGRFREIRYDDLGEDPGPELNRKLQRGELFAWFRIGADPVQSTEGSEYVSNNATDFDLRNWYQGLAAAAVRERRIEKLGLSRAEAESILQSFSFEAKKVTTEGAIEKTSKADRALGLAPMAFVYLLWISIITAASMLLTNTVEEKSNRIIEVLLSSVSPFQLMSGKVLGIAATGMIIVCSWALFFVIGVGLLPSFVPAAAEWQLDQVLANPRFLASFLGYFLAGYLLYAALLVGLGAVCNSLKEAQNLMQPVFLLMFLPILAMPFIADEPNGIVARVLTYIPTFTPFVMMNRAAGDPPLIDYVVSSLLLLATIALAFWAAAKVFRIGVLMTGKPPRLREILRWVRAPVR